MSRSSYVAQRRSRTLRASAPKARTGADRAYRGADLRFVARRPTRRRNLGRSAVEVGPNEREHHAVVSTTVRLAVISKDSFANEAGLLDRAT